MILIRVDLGDEYGLGHGSRMVAVAQELTRLGKEVAFLTRTPALPRWFRKQGYDWRVYCEPDVSEITLLSKPLPGGADVLVVDRKDYYESWLFRELRSQTKVVRIDHPDAEEGTADAVILPTMHQPAYVLERLVEQFDERLLCGADYVILSSAAASIPPIGYRQREPTIVFFAGGSDPHGLLADLYTCTQALDLPGVRKVFAVGALASKLSLDPPGPDTVITGFSHALLAKAAMAVGPLGVTAYEAMRLGTPLLTFPGILSDGECVEALEQATDGAVVVLATTPEIRREELCQALLELYTDPERRAWMSHQTRQMIDGQGARRVAEAIAAL